jgi:arabinofuranan 3-O-arabinosyltransferase
VPGTDPKLRLEGAWAVQRLRIAAACLALTLLVFTQSSGFVATDTKLDLVVDPWHFLKRSLTLWDPLANAGQVQDQAYGYLFPMGPYFLLGHISGLPPWVVQRSWESLLVVVAFLGVLRLARLMGVERFWPRVICALVYALSPRMLSELGVISSELLPMVALPWMLIPLVRGSRTGSTRRAAMLSGLAVLLCGGVNASATLAVLPVPALWLITRSRGSRRRSLAAWWTAAVALASLWWAIPLILMGRYSSQFLDWIESSTVTTSVTSMFSVLRGVDHWQSYLGPGEWPGAWILASAPAAIVATATIAGAGLAGLSRRDTPHRAFLWTCLLLGLVILTSGYVSHSGPLYAHSIRSMLDAQLNPFRNIHKFDPVVRLPIALGVGYLLARAPLPTWAQIPFSRGRLQLPVRALAAGVVIATGIVAIAPAITGRLVPQPRVPVTQDWWKQTGDWLAAHDGTGRALVVPGAAQPSYIWGETRDDALQPAARSPWSVRDATPLAQAGYVRMLDNVEQRLAQGRPDESLSTVLATAGIRYIVVRNDLDTDKSSATPLLLVHATVDNSHLIRRVAGVGEPFIVPADVNRLMDGAQAKQRPAVEIYENEAWSGGVSVVPVSNAFTATGSGDELSALAGRGTAGPRHPVLFAPRAASIGGSETPFIVTDGLRKREFGFGGIDRYSSVLTDDEPYRATRRVNDYLPHGVTSQTVATYDGAVSIRASSSGSDATAFINRSPNNSPFAAIDDDPTTAWMSGSPVAKEQWWQIDLVSAVTPGQIQISFPAGLSDYPSRIEFTTSSGSKQVDVSPDALLQPVDLPPGPTQLVRISVVEMAHGSTSTSVGLSTVIIPGVQVSRTLRVSGGGTPDIFAFDVSPGFRSDCVSVEGRPVCDPAIARQGEEDQALDRSFTVADDVTYRTAATVRFRPGDAVDRLLDARQPMSVTSSSTNSDDPRSRPGAIFDDRSDTGWIAHAGDLKPSLTIRMNHPAIIRGLNLTTDALLPAAHPTAITVSAGDRVWSFDVGDDGIVTFPIGLRVSTLKIVIDGATVRTSTSSVSGKTILLPAGISELRLVGQGVPQPTSVNRASVGCSDGLDLLIDGRRIPMHASATIGEVLGGEAVLAAPCGDDRFSMHAGEHRVRLEQRSMLAPMSLTLTRDGFLPRADQAVDAWVGKWSDSSRSVNVAASVSSLLIVRENANPGWKATVNGATLTPTIVNGWQQAWILPGGTKGLVSLTFAPQRTFAIGLVCGLFAALALLVLLLYPVPRAASREDHRPISGPHRKSIPAGVSVACAFAGGLVPAGFVGALLGAGVTTAVLIWGVAGRRVAYPVGGLVFVLVGGLAAHAPLGDGSTFGLHSAAATQLGCVLALSFCFGSILSSFPDGDRQLLENLRRRGLSIPNHDTAATPVAAAPAPRKIFQKLPWNGDRSKTR